MKYQIGDLLKYKALHDEGDLAIIIRRYETDESILYDIHWLCEGFNLTKGYTERIFNNLGHWEKLT